MNLGTIILEATNDMDREIGNLKWMTVRRIMGKHIEAARKELLRTAAQEREFLERENKSIINIEQ